MRRVLRRGIGIAIVLGCSALLASPGELDAGAVAAALDRWLRGTRDLECRFEQRLVSGALGAAGTESGRLRLLRPGRMRWDYRKPEAKVAILEGNRTLVYLPSDRQLLRGTLSAEGSLLASLLGGDGRTLDRFVASLEGTPAVDGEEAYRLRLVPREREGSFESVTLHVRPSDFAVAGADVLDAAGNLVEYRFSALRRNRGLPAAAFRFEPPRGTEIVEAP